MKIILASKSPRRRVLLKKMVRRFKVIDPCAREIHHKGKTPAQNAAANALRKAQKVSASYPAHLVIGADTIVVYRSHILGKPKNHREAERMLLRLSGKVHDVITGVALITPPKPPLTVRGGRVGLKIVFNESTRVKMKRMSLKKIRDYFKKVDPLDKAGAYGIQEKPRIVEWIRGSYSNVMGLPVEKLKKELKNLLR